MRNATYGICAAAVVAIGLAQATGPAAIKSAAQVLAEIDRVPASTQPSARAALLREAKSLAQSVAALPAEEAASRWLALSDRQRASLDEGRETILGAYEPPVSFAAVLAAMPTSAQLPALKAALDARPLDDAGGQRVAFLKMLVATLRGAPAADLDAAFADLRRAAESRKTPAARIDARIVEFRDALAADVVGHADEVESFTREIAERSEGFARAHPVDVPDLVSIVGDAKARAMIDAAIKSGRTLRVPTGDATRRLARDAALAAIATATAPQWSLCQDVDAIDLYEATTRQFAPDGPPATRPAGRSSRGISDLTGDGERDPYADARQAARTYYLFGLIARGRADDALRVAAEMKAAGRFRDYQVTRAAESLYAQGFAEQVYQFLTRAVAADPDAPFWPVLVASAAKSGHAAELLAITRDAAAKPGRDAASRRASDLHLADALLAADALDEGIALLASSSSSSGDADADAEVAARTRLATIGRLTSRAALVGESLDAATQRLLASPDRGAASPSLAAWAREMTLAGRADALADALGQQVGHVKKAERYSYEVPGPLTLLARVYFDAGRAADVMTMADAFPQWGVGDVAALPAGSDGHEASTPATFYVAWALFKTGQRDAGLRVLDDLLDRRPGLDAAYRLLMENDAGAAAKLDARFARDAFEERPLIWRAAIERDLGRLDDAERTLRQAIAIDPSDGDEGKGDRMRVYAELAEVLAAKGDAKQADVLRGVVQTIRLSEDADDAWAAGLLGRAVTMYEAALGHFADAYCVQSRLAVQLADMGREDEAAEHYQKAYELMPDSFGRVESHCFGCEGAFRSAKAQGIAERVFTRLLAKDPTKPQLHYLLGYLRTSEERYADALPAFRRAVELDPRYLNAWKSLLGCDEHVSLAPDERDRATIAIVTLDPLGRHGDASAEKVRDVAAFYAAASAGASRDRPASPDATYPLRAAALALAATPRQPGFDPFEWPARFSDRRAQTPGTLVAEHPRVKPIVEWLDTFGQ